MSVTPGTNQRGFGVPVGDECQCLWPFVPSRDMRARLNAGRRDAPDAIKFVPFRDFPDSLFLARNRLKSCLHTFRYGRYVVYYGRHGVNYDRYGVNYDRHGVNYDRHGVRDGSISIAGDMILHRGAPPVAGLAQWNCLYLICHNLISRGRR